MKKHMIKILMAGFMLCTSSGAWSAELGGGPWSPDSQATKDQDAEKQFRICNQCTQAMAAQNGGDPSRYIETCNTRITRDMGNPLGSGSLASPQVHQYN